MKILIIEDEMDLRNAIVQHLESQQYRCESAANLDEALLKIGVYEYDCIILDLMLAGKDGLQILEQLKADGKQEGVLIISAKNSLEDRINGLELGADDYLSKPFHLSELSARVYSIIRRRKFRSGNIIDLDSLKINLLAKSVTIHDKPFDLTKTEFDLLLFFVGNKGVVISKSAIAEHLSGDLADMFDNHDFIYAHIKNLKKKLGDAGLTGSIRTIYGIGYKWEL